MTGKLDYVIIRPGGLKSEPATGNAILTGCVHGLICVWLCVHVDRWVVESVVQLSWEIP